MDSTVEQYHKFKKTSENSLWERLQPRTVFEMIFAAEAAPTGYLTNGLGVVKDK